MWLVIFFGFPKKLDYILLQFRTVDGEIVFILVSAIVNAVDLMWLDIYYIYLLYDISIYLVVLLVDILVVAVVCTWLWWWLALVQIQSFNHDVVISKVELCHSVLCAVFFNFQLFFVVCLLLGCLSSFCRCPHLTVFAAVGWCCTSWCCCSGYCCCGCCFFRSFFSLIASFCPFVCSFVSLFVRLFIWLFSCFCHLFFFVFFLQCFWNLFVSVLAYFILFAIDFILFFFVSSYLHSFLPVCI